jgi:methylthioribose-1-phosphate isomerase
MQSWIIRGAAICTALLLLAGCNTDPPKVAAVNPGEAMAALKTTLDAWKGGKSMESLGTASPPIVAQDIDWMQGKKLTSYEVVGDGIPQDANLRVEVKLTLEGEAKERKVFYIVGTSPKLTVFRAFE